MACEIQSLRLSLAPPQLTCSQGRKTDHDNERGAVFVGAFLPPSRSENLKCADNGGGIS